MSVNETTNEAGVGKRGVADGGLPGLEAARGSWAELVSAALVGTDRRAFVPGPAIPAGAEPAQALLQQAMMLAVPALTDARPARYEGPPPEPAPADDRPLIPQAAQLRLHAVLDSYPTYLAEWLAAVQASGRRMPLAAMPALLEAGRGKPPVRGALAEALGTRGHWFARQNPDWRYLLREPFGPLRPEDWDGPDPDARVAYANGLYAADPAAARALLETAWPTLTADVKLNLLALVGLHGTEGDLPFVKGLTQDSSKQVRDRAPGVEAQLKRRGEGSGELSAEEFVAEVERIAADEGIGNEFYRFATRRARDRWSLEGARAILAALVGYCHEPVSDAPGDRPAENRRDRGFWAEDQIIDILADRAPLELLPDVERVVQAQTGGRAAGWIRPFDFSRLLTPLGFRADMHAELTASADAEPGQE